MTATARCIYRGCEFDPGAGEGDHIVPAAWGEFAGLPRFRGACPGCNNEIGRSEEQLLRCGPEAYLARVSQVQRRRRPGQDAWRGAAGAPTPSMVTDRFGARLRVRPVQGDPRFIETVDQIVVIDRHDRHHQLPVFEGMTAAVLRDRIDGLGLEGPLKAHLHATQGSFEWLTRLAEELWPGAEHRELPTTEAGVHPVEGQVTFTFTDRYFRALAKVAFHYYLAHGLRGLRGDESGFDDLRRFILDGDDAERFFPSARSTPVYFGTPFGDIVGGGTLSSPEWCHLLAFDDTQEQIAVFMQFFIGPGHMGLAHHVVLGPTADPGGVRSGRAHTLFSPTSSIRGHVQEMRVVRGGRPPLIISPGLETSDGANAIFTEYGRSSLIHDYRATVR